jgi:orotidine-5'-phosphate decarboxylase
VGLDCGLDTLPAHLAGTQDAIFLFNKAIIDATADLVCAYKPNPAFYERAGASGIEQLRQTCQYILQTYPHTPIILDAKRADIGNTNQGYAVFAFNYLQADSITLHPYLGREALEPFLAHKDKGIIILCRTSNPGAGEFQDLLCGDQKLYEVVAAHVRDEWNIAGNCLLVVGATYPEELARVRAIVGPNMTFLVPGVGSQGGDLRQALQAGLNDQGGGLIINASRGVIFASDGKNFGVAARQAAAQMRDDINRYR